MENNFKPRNERFIVSFEVEVAHVGVNFEGSQQDFYSNEVRVIEAKVLDHLSELINIRTHRSKVVKIKVQ